MIESECQTWRYCLPVVIVISCLFFYCFGRLRSALLISISHNSNIVHTMTYNWIDTGKVGVGFGNEGERAPHWFLFHTTAILSTQCLTIDTGAVGVGTRKNAPPVISISHNSNIFHTMSYNRRGCSGGGNEKERAPSDFYFTQQQYCPHTVLS